MEWEVNMIYCCDCQEQKNKNDLKLQYNPYKFKKTAYCKKCGTAALIVKKVKHD